MSSSFRPVAAGLLLSALSGAGPALRAEVSLTISDFSGSLSNLSDSAGGSATNGLLWGILVDTDGTGFANLNLSPESLALLVAGTELTKGKRFFPSSSPTRSIPAGPGAGSGIPTSASGIDPYAFGDVAENQAFAIVWFDSGIELGDPLLYHSGYGLLARTGLTLPADGTDASFSFLFTDPDPVRPADQTLQALIPPSAAASTVAIDPGGGGPVADHLAFTFPVAVPHADSGALTFKLLKSSDLSQWSEATTPIETVSDDGTTRVLRLVDPDPVGTHPRRFLRLEITP